MKNPSKSNKRHRRNTLNTIALVILLFIGLTMVFAFQYFFESEEPEVKEIALVNLYFQSNADGSWGYEPRYITYEDNLSLIQNILSSLLEGPENASNIPSLNSVTIEGVDLITATNTLAISFMQNFNDISPPYRTVAMVSLVYTLTELAYIDNIVFYIGYEPMLAADGSLFGIRNRENTHLEQGIQPILTDTATIILFFPNEQMTGLVAEQRTISISPLQELEAFIMDALIKGPNIPGLSPSLPQDTVYNRIERTGDTLIIDFSSDFPALLSGGVTAEEMVLMSLANTFTEHTDILRIQILVDGLIVTADEQSFFHFDISRPLERNENLIID